MTIDPDVEALLRAAMKERGASFKKALNDGLRIGLQAGRTRPSTPYRLKTHRMGFHPELRLDKAIDLAARMEEEELARKLSLRK